MNRAWNALALRPWLLVAAGLALTIAACGTDDDSGDGGDGTTDGGGTNGDGGGSDLGLDLGGVGGDAGGSDLGTGGEDTGGGTTTAPVLGFDCPDGQTVSAGLNSGFTAGGIARDFYAEMPASIGDTPLGVIFSWHGVGDNIDNFRHFFTGAPSSDPSFPFIVITPQDRQLLPISTPAGMAWEIMTSEPGDANGEVALFKGVLGCLDSQYTLDTRHIHTFGFSGGAIMANMLHARFPDLIPSVVAFSGAWFNNQQTVDSINTMGLAVDVGWNDFAAGSEGTVWLTHGGSADNYTVGVEIINFDTAAGFDVPFLVTNHRTVIDCTHTLGHRNDPAITTAMIVDFFKNHPFGATSPYWADGLPSGFPGTCTLN